MMKLLFSFGLLILISFFFQILVGFRTKYKILRYIPLYCFGITIIFAIIALLKDPGFIIGGNVLVAVIWVMIGLCFIVGYGLAIILFGKWRNG